MGHGGGWRSGRSRGDPVLADWRFWTSRSEAIVIPHKDSVRGFVYDVHTGALRELS